MASTMQRTAAAVLLMACLTAPALAALPLVAFTPKYPSTTEQFSLRLAEQSPADTLNCNDVVAKLSVYNGAVQTDGLAALKCPVGSSLTAGTGSPWACGWQPVGPCGPLPAGTYGWQVDYTLKSNGTLIGSTSGGFPKTFGPGALQVGGPTEVRVLLNPSATVIRKKKDVLSIKVDVTGIQNCSPTRPVPVSIFVSDITQLSCSLPANTNLDATCTKLAAPITCTGLTATRTKPVVVYVNVLAGADQRTYQDVPQSYVVVHVSNHGETPSGQ